MNRYVLDGVLADMRAGRRVLIVGETQRHARHSFNELADRVGADAQVVRANGRERIQHVGGGSIVFSSLGSGSARGLSFDVVFIDADALPNQIAQLTPCVASSGGEVMRR